MKYSLHILKKERSRLWNQREKLELQIKESPAQDLIEVRQALPAILERMKAAETIDDHKEIQAELKVLQKKEETAKRKLDKQISGKLWDRVSDIDSKIADLDQVIFRTEIRG